MELYEFYSQKTIYIYFIVCEGERERGEVYALQCTCEKYEVMAHFFNHWKSKYLKQTHVIRDGDKDALRHLVDP